MVDGPLMTQGYTPAGSTNDKLPAGNKFPQGTRKQIYKVTTSISNIPNVQTAYFHHSINPTAIYQPTVLGMAGNMMSNVPTGIPFNINTSCQKLGLGESVSPPSDPLAKYRQAQFKTDSLEAKWDTTLLGIDGGQTSYMLGRLADTSLSEATLTAELVARSPLSDTVLITFLQREPSPSGMFFKNVMLPNLPVSSSIYPEYTKLCGVYPDSITDTLRTVEGYNPYSNTLRKLEIEMQNAEAEKEELVAEYTGHFVFNDSLSYALSFMDSINDGSFKRLHPLVGTYAAIDSLSKARTLLNGFTPTSQDEDDWKTLTDIHLSLLEDTLTWFQMDSTQDAFILDMAYKPYPYSLPTTLAQNVRRLVYNEDFSDSLNFVIPAEAKLEGNEQPLQQNPTYTYSSKLYPNPAKDKATLEYQLAEGEKGELVMMDAMGRKIVSVELLSAYTKISIDISAFSQGIYLYRAYTKDRNLSNGKLIIER